MSAYSLTVTNCLFESNIAKSMVFVHNEDALVDDTVFVENGIYGANDITQVLGNSHNNE
jgi:hypothetical protein